MQPEIQSLFDAIIDGSAKGATDAAKNALDAGLDPSSILNEGMIAAMKEVGKRFEEGEFYVPEMLVAARAMQSALSLMKPYLKDANIQSAGRVAIGTIKGDLHDIGKNLVAMMLEGAGFEIIDLGTDVAPEKFVNAVQTQAVDLVALSALLTTTMPTMRTVIESLNTAGLRGKVKVMIGGAPVTETYAQQIGADGYAPDASRAVALAQSLVKRA
jgi:5-methyltetrahydrofolate--homocysteine methyltransferase